MVEKEREGERGWEDEEMEERLYVSLFLSFFVILGEFLVVEVNELLFMLERFCY